MVRSIPKESFVNKFDKGYTDGIVVLSGQLSL
jgi:hypothetical protein